MGKMKAFILLQSICVLAAPANRDRTLFKVHDQAQSGFLWTSIGLAVITAFLQGLVTALAFMTESSNYWTFRFRLARIEHWWWTLVSLLLLISLVLIVLSFLSGNNNEAISILALSTATFLTIVQYMIPSWRSRHFIENRWLAWTGSSRTTINAAKARFCGGKTHWQSLAKQVHVGKIKPTPSDWYGWRFWPASGLSYDPTDILRNVELSQSKPLEASADDQRKSIYDIGDTDPRDVSLLWGIEQGFRRRVSRATSSMPIGLLQSRPFTIDGYSGDGLCLAMGILGRNKGLSPRNLVFNAGGGVTGSLENFGTWAPRPNKVLRSYYWKVMDQQYSGLGPSYVAAATETALLIKDISHSAMKAWLQAGLEHQSMILNRDLRNLGSKNKTAELRAHYESSYVSMIISLNYMPSNASNAFSRHVTISRPDLTCLGLLLKARDEPEPVWWNDPFVQGVRRAEINALEGRHWKQSMALLLGLSEWPEGFEDNSSNWGNQTKNPSNF